MHARHEIDDNARRKPSSRPKPGQGLAAPASALLDMQQKLGNAAVADMIAQRSPHRAPPVEGAPIIPPRAETVGSEHGHPAQRAAEPAAVQRWAFVNGQQQSPDGLKGKKKNFARDELVRDYTSDDEFEKHAAGKTDYLGNLPGPASAGTWVRFERRGTNVLGEHHAKVTLPDVLTAVDSKDFIYEAFATDDFSSEPKTREAESKSLKATREKLGIAKEHDLGRYGLESMYPKMGILMSDLFYAINDRQQRLDYARGGSKQHSGLQMTRYVKIAWEYGKDIRKYSGQEGLTPARAELAAFRPSAAGLDGYIRKLPDEGCIGDLLDDAEDYRGPLREYLEVLIPELWAREPRTPLTETQQQNGRALANMGERMSQERNSKIRDRVAKEVHRGVRYVGMGEDHREYLANNLNDPKITFYQMDGAELQGFEDRTDQLRPQQ